MSQESLLISTWGVSREQVVSREELETERGWEESKEVLLPSLSRVEVYISDHNHSESRQQEQPQR